MWPACQRPLERVGTPPAPLWSATLHSGTTHQAAFSGSLLSLSARCHGDQFALGRRHSGQDSCAEPLRDHSVLCRAAVGDKPCVAFDRSSSILGFITACPIVTGEKRAVSRFTRIMRRLAILAGVIGLAVGSAIAYFQFAELVPIRAQHDRFQALMATPGVVVFSRGR
jgi:hypothetical protein